MSSTNSQNPPGITDGPCKRQPSKHVTKNGDTHTKRKAKTSSGPVKKLPKVSESDQGNSRRASVEDVLQPVTTSHTQPDHADRVLEATDGSSNNDMPALKDIEEDSDGDNDEDPEDDEAELCMFCSLHAFLASGNN